MRRILPLRSFSSLRRQTLAHRINNNDTYYTNTTPLRLQSSYAHQHDFLNDNVPNNGEALRIQKLASPPQHKSPRLKGCKIDVKSKTFRDSMEQTKAQVDKLNSRLHIVRQGGGEIPVRKHLSRNKMMPRDRIDMLIDPGEYAYVNFLETGLKYFNVDPSTQYY